MFLEFFGAILPFLILVGFYAIVHGLFSSIKHSARQQEPLQKGLALEFFPVPRMQFAIRLVLTFLAAFAILVAVDLRKENGGFYAALGPLTVFLLILLVRPVPVVLDRSGIRQSRWFLPDKEIAWKDLASVGYGQNTGTTYVRSKKGGPKIRFSAFLVGRSRFKREIREHVNSVDISVDDD